MVIRNGYASQLSLSSSDFCRRNRNVRQGVALVGKAYILGQRNEKTQERA